MTWRTCAKTAHNGSRTAANTSIAAAQSRVNKNCHQEENSLALAASTMTAFFCRDTAGKKENGTHAGRTKNVPSSSNNAKVVWNKLRSFQPRTFFSKKFIILSDRNF
jgi:hypothetical protein